MAFDLQGVAVRVSGFSRIRMKLGILHGSAAMVMGAGVLFCAPLPAIAQTSAPVVSREVVQPLPDPNKARLDDALKRLGRNPKDETALLDAGQAAASLHNYQAAIGFFKRASEVSPQNPQAQAGMATALMFSGDPVAALPLFAAADKGGIGRAQIAADWGLAYDLVGDNVAAQRLYAQANKPGDASVVRMRLAISQAIAGDAKAADATLMPLLREQDKPAWRTRAFVYAIDGDVKKAQSTVEAILPPKLAEQVTPYMRYVPRLTHAQQAAAANMGDFPRASEIGTDDPKIAAYARSNTRSADAGLVPQGPALGTGRVRKLRGTRASVSQAKPSRELRGNMQSATPAASEIRAQTRSDAPVSPFATSMRTPSGELPALTAAQIMSGNSGSTVRPVESRVAEGEAPKMPPATRSAPVRAASTPPGFDPAALAASRGASAPAPAASAPTPAPAPVPSSTSYAVVQQVPSSYSSPAATAPEAAPSAPVEEKPSLSQIFADLGKPVLAVAPAPGAVDLRQIDPAKPAPPPAPEPKKAEVDTKKAAAEAKKAEEEARKAKAEEEAKKAKAEERARKKAERKKPAPLKAPSRKWVQVGIGRSPKAISWDWNKLVKQAPRAFKGHEPYISKYGVTNRVLVGPFATDAAAAKFIAELKKAGIDNYLPWTSDEGEAVNPLSDK